MTPLLVCAATWMEMKAFLAEEDADAPAEGQPLLLPDGTLCAVTGVGIPLTLGRLFPLVAQTRPAAILNIGIAGVYPAREARIGEVVIGTWEVYGDVGFELPEEPGFRSLADSPFGADFYASGFPLAEPPMRDKVSIQAPVEDRSQPSVPIAVHRGRGCTVNCCTGTQRTGRLRAERFDALFESMEGAAVAQVGRQFGISVSEVRALSNIAGCRDMRPENIALALAHLADFFRSRGREVGAAGGDGVHNAGAARNDLQ